VDGADPAWTSPSARRLDNRIPSIMLLMQSLGSKFQNWRNKKSNIPHSPPAGFTKREPSG
jgi:hypothetical protein